VQASDLLYKINLALHIQTPTRNLHEVCILVARHQNEPKTGQDAANFQVAEFFAEDSLHFATIEFDRSQVKRAGDHIDHAPNELSAARVEDQFGDTVGRRDGGFEVRTTLAN